MHLVIYQNVFSVGFKIKMGEFGSKEIKERKEKAPKGRPKKISVFSKKSLLFSRRFENQCSTYEKVLPYAPADVDQLTWWKIHQEALPLLTFTLRIILEIPVTSSKYE